MDAIPGTNGARLGGRGCFVKDEMRLILLMYEMRGIRVSRSSIIKHHFFFEMELTHAQYEPTGVRLTRGLFGLVFGSKQLLAISITRECSGQHSTSDDSETFSASQARQDRRGQFCAVLCAKDYAGLPKSWRSHGGGFCLDFLQLEAFWFQTLGAAKLEDLFHDHPL